MSETAAPTAEPLVILSTPGCYRCRTVEKHLTSKGIPFLKVDVSEPGEYRTKMDEAGLKSVPQTFRLCDLDTPDSWVEGFDPDAINRLF